MSSLKPLSVSKEVTASSIFRRIRSWRLNISWLTTRTLEQSLGGVLCYYHGLLCIRSTSRNPRCRARVWDRVGHTLLFNIPIVQGSQWQRIDSKYHIIHTWGKSVHRAYVRNAEHSSWREILCLYHFKFWVGNCNHLGPKKTLPMFSGIVLHSEPSMADSWPSGVKPGLSTFRAARGKLRP